jgi:hypothetical protein
MSCGSRLSVGLNDNKVSPTENSRNYCTERQERDGLSFEQKYYECAVGVHFAATPADKCEDDKTEIWRFAAYELKSNDFDKIFKNCHATCSFGLAKDI